MRASFAAPSPRGVPMPPSPPTSAARDLLLGALALRLGLVPRDALLGALHAWVLDRSRPLGAVLHDRGHLPADRLRRLDALVAEHLPALGGDAEPDAVGPPPLPPGLDAGA